MEADPKSLSREGLSVTFAAIRSSGSWQLIDFASGDWEGIVLGLTENQHWCGPPRHVPAWAEDWGRTTPYEEYPSLEPDMDSRSSVLSYPQNWPSLVGV